MRDLLLGRHNPCRSPFSTIESPCENLCSNTVGDDGNLCSIITLSQEDSCPVTSLLLAISCSSISCPCESPWSSPMNEDGNPAQLLQSRAETFVPLHFQRAGSILQQLHSHAEFLLHHMVDAREPLLKLLRPLVGATVHPPCFPSCETNNFCHFC